MKHNIDFQPVFEVDDQFPPHILINSFIGIEEGNAPSSLYFVRDGKLFVDRRVISPSALADHLLDQGLEALYSDHLRAEKKSLVKSAVEEHILVTAPLYKQNNTLSVLLLYGQDDPSTLSASIQADLVEAKALWVEVRRLRGVSATVQAEIEDIQDFDELYAFDAVSRVTELVDADDIV